MNVDPHGAAAHAYRAADYIAEFGWWGGDGGRGPDGEVCLLFALASTSRVNRTLGTVFTLLNDKLGVMPVEWNDHHATNGDEVIAVLREAGAELALREEVETMGASSPKVLEVVA